MQKRSLHITDILFPRIEKSNNVSSDSSECLWILDPSPLILGAFGPYYVYTKHINSYNEPPELQNRDPRFWTSISDKF